MFAYQHGYWFVVPDDYIPYFAALTGLPDLRSLFHPGPAGARPYPRSSRSDRPDQLQAATGLHNQRGPLLSAAPCHLLNREHKSGSIAVHFTSSLALSSSTDPINRTAFVTPQLEMGVEYRSTPHRVRRRPETRHCCQHQGSFEEGSSLHGLLREGIFIFGVNNCRWQSRPLEDGCTYPGFATAW
jgi:hypothetical protein